MARCSNSTSKERLHHELELARQRVRQLEHILGSDEALEHYLQEERGREAEREAAVRELEKRAEQLRVQTATVAKAYEKRMRPRRRGRPASKDTRKRAQMLAKALDVELAKGGPKKRAIAAVVERFRVGEKTVRNAHDALGEVRRTRKRKRNGK